MVEELPKWHAELVREGLTIDEDFTFQSQPVMPPNAVEERTVSSPIHLMLESNLRATCSIMRTSAPRSLRISIASISSSRFHV